MAKFYRNYKEAHTAAVTLARLYDDACDVGISVKSAKTGRVVTYYLSDEERDASGEDIAGWYFKPIAEDVRRCPECANTEVLIIND